MKSQTHMRLRRKIFHNGGFTLVEIMIVVLIIGVLMNIAAPAFVHARDEGQSKTCISYLKKMQGAKEQFAYDAKKTGDATVLWTDIVPYLNIPGADTTHPPKCPSNGASYTYGTLITTQPVCGYGGPVTDPTLAHVVK